MKALSRFFRDESGMSSLEVVMLLAIAALFTAVVIAFVKLVPEWCKTQLSKEL